MTEHDPQEPPPGDGQGHSPHSRPTDPTGEGGRTIDTQARPAGDPPPAAGGHGDSGGGSGPGSTANGAFGSHPWAMLCHLTGLLNCCPFLGLGVTIAAWQLTRDKDPEVDWHAKESLNLQLNVVPLGLALFFMTFLHDACALFGLAVIALPVLMMAVLIYTLLGAIQAAEGRRYRYPWIKRPLT